MPITISIVEDDPHVRSALTVLIAGTPNFEVRGAFDSAEEALRAIPHSQPDVVLMDVELPKLSGIECTRQLKILCPSLFIIMLTVSDSADDVFPALAAGASGYLLKHTPPSQLLQAIEEVHRHGAPMSPPIARMVVQTFFQKGQPAPYRLTEREEMVLRHLARGWRYKEIASHLGVSVETIHTHVRHLYAKLHVTSRTEAVVKYLGR